MKNRLVSTGNDHREKECILFIENITESGLKRVVDNNLKISLYPNPKRDS